MSRRSRARRDARRCYRTAQAALPQSWTVTQLAAATGLSLERTRAAQKRLLDDGRMRDTGGTRFGTLRVKSVDPAWEQAVYDYLSGTGA